MEGGRKSSCSSSSTGTSKAGAIPVDLSKVKPEYRFGRPRTQRGKGAKCPRCKNVGADLWQCIHCQYEFGNKLEVVDVTASAEILAKTFLPRIIKVEKPPVPDYDPDGGNHEMVTQPVNPPPATKEKAVKTPASSVPVAPPASTSSRKETSYGTPNKSRDDARGNQNLKTSRNEVSSSEHCLSVKKSRVDIGADAEAVSSPRISTTTAEVTASDFIGHKSAENAENRRESTNSSSSSSSYKSRRDGPQRSRSKQDKLIPVEKCVRIFQQISARSLEKSVLNSAPTFTNNRCRLDAQVNLEDVIVEETRVDGKPKIIRLLRIPSQGPGVDVILKNKDYRDEVDKVIFGAPSSLQLVEQVLIFFSGISAVRFGQNSLNVTEGDKPGRLSLDTKKLQNKTMKSFELTFDRKHFSELSREGQELVTTKIKQVIVMAHKCFANLEECNITIPYTTDLNRVLDELVARFPSKGEKITKFSQNIIYYMLNKVEGLDTKNTEKRSRSSAKIDCGESSPYKSDDGLSTERSATSPNDAVTSRIPCTLDPNVRIKTENTPVKSTVKTANKGPIDTIEITSSSDEDDPIIPVPISSKPSHSNDGASASATKKRDREEDDDGSLLFWNEDTSTPTVPGHFAPCRYCGTLSRNLIKCENCHSVFDMKVPISELKRPKLDEVTMNRPSAAYSTPSPSLRPAIVTCKSISIGDYLVVMKSSDKFPNVVTFSADSISFTVPHLRDKKNLKCEIKHTYIETVTAHFELSLPLMAVKTSDGFAENVRALLGLNDGKEKGNYYSFDGKACQKLIIIQPVDISPLAKQRIQDLFGAKLTLVPLDVAKNVKVMGECKCGQQK